MHRSHVNALIGALALACASTASSISLEELNQRYTPIPTVPESELPPLKNKPEPFSGTVHHPGFEAHTWVKFPFVENPGSFGFDPKGRLFVAEVNRFWQGVPDLRGANELIPEDFQSVTVEDRAKLYEKWAARFPPTFFTNTADRILRLEDRDGNGAADHRTLFSDRFHEPLDGIGFSVLAENDAVYFTCIPNLWKLTDRDDDGVADDAQKLVEGFGVRVSFIGHDLHGITRGPDGRLYFSVGDRGYHVTTEDGRVFAGSGRGAIFRCESDGSGFEVFCKGLRNPQELAFDELGNLFTFDNTGDIGDEARMVYALEGSDSGWDMSHQSAHQYVTFLDWEEFHPETSMWVAERMYDTFNEEQPQWVYPPASHVARGPSGVTWLTGGSVPQNLRGKFLLANYRGASQGCEVLSVGIEPKGAGYAAKLVDVFVEGVGVSDVELGPDGNIYLCDFGGGWSINTNGAIEVLTPKTPALKAAGAETKAMLAKGAEGASADELKGWLGSNDKRVRQMAQFELANKNDAATLAAIAADSSKPVTTRLHGIWGLDQLGRRGTDVAAALLTLTQDEADEIRANAARALGSIRAESARDVLVGLLKDRSPRVRSLAAIALGRVAKPGDAQVTDALFAMAAENGGSGHVDPVVRHSALSALDLVATQEAVFARASSEHREERLMALLWLRRHESAECAAFLDDADAQIRHEAIRAIYDTNAMDGPAGERIAALAGTAADLPPTLQLRVVAANYRLGGDDHAGQLVAIAGNDKLPVETRTAAIHALGLWEKKIVTDPVNGHYRPLPERERTLAALGKAIDADLRKLLASSLPAELSSLALNLADATGVTLDAETLKGFALNPDLEAEVRVAALGSLVGSAPDAAPDVVRELLDDKAPTVSAAALAHGFALKLDGLVEVAQKAIASEPLAKARAGIAGLASTQPESIPALWNDREAKGVRKELWLDLFLALQTSSDAAQQALAAEFTAADPGAIHRLTETGGDIAKGDKVFRNQGACLQCHKVGSDGGVQGPALTKVGERLTPEKMVESLVNPNAEIAEGYGMAAVTLADGSLVMGRIAKQNKKQITVIGPDGKATIIPAAKVATIAPPVSAMPPMGLSLPPADLRDLIAYLTSRTSATAGKEMDAESHGEEEDAKIAR